MTAEVEIPNLAPGTSNPGTRNPGTRPLSRRFRRLVSMPWDEIAGRGFQEASKWIDRVTVGKPIDANTLLADHAPALATPAAILQMLRESAPERFFAGVADPLAIADRLPNHRADVLTAADAIVQNRFDLLGYRTLSFGDPIDWHFDPISLRRAPRLHWSRLNPLDPTSVGDSKVVWELNRHQWLVRLAQAYAFTGDEHYAQTCVRTVEAWLEANPYGVGVNWASSLEVAYRLMSWSWMLLLLRDSAALPGEHLTTMLAAIWMHASHVARYLSFYFSPNTHLTGEALGLFYASTLFQEFKEARQWRELSARVLIAESHAQICGDGVHFERSTCYHRYTAETYQQFVLLAQRNGVAVPADVLDRLQSLVEFLLVVRQPDGRLPEIGDADGGRLQPLVDRSQHDPSGVLALGAAMFRRGDFAWAAGAGAPEVPWLMGIGGVGAFDDVRPGPPVTAPSRLFPSGGFAVMRATWDHDAHQMVVDVGPLGCPHSAAHGHADLLSVQCSVFGEPCLVDAGTYCYTSEAEWRSFFRGTAAHSTVRVDGTEQVEPEGPFSWQSRPRLNVREWRSTPRFDFVDAEHDAYASLPGGVMHRRRVMFIKPHYWVVIDDVTDKGGTRDREGVSPASSETPSRSLVHQIELGFQFAPMAVTIEREAWARAITPAGNALWVGSFSSGLARAEVKTGELAPIRGWISTDYGRRTPAPMLVFSCETPLPWRAITVLLPQRGSGSPKPVVEPMFDDHHLPIGVDVAQRAEAILVDEADVIVSAT